MGCNEFLFIQRIKNQIACSGEFGPPTFPSGSFQFTLRALSTMASSACRMETTRFAKSAERPRKKTKRQAKKRADHASTYSFVGFSAFTRISMVGTSIAAG